MEKTAKGFEDLKGLENDYDQIQKVAIGGMAEVYRGRQKNLDRPVAIKRIKAEFRSSADLQERFKREARSAANLLHHNLAHVYDYRVMGNESYIIMEYIDGFDLAQIQEKVSALPIDVAAMIAVKILHGLVQVHSHGMIHRDIKPDNIRVTTRGEVKIMDFGIALDPGEANLTQPGILIGSPHYLAPEQILGEKIDQRADIFAFGITFYEMLTGKRPFYERDGQSVYSIIKTGKFEKIEDIRGDAPGFLTNVIERCLRVNPEDRPRSAESIAQTLQEYLLNEHTLSFEPRIRQFLMETGLLSGDASLIEVNEKTLAPVRSFSIKRFCKKNKLLILAALFACGSYFAYQNYVELKTQETEEVEVVDDAQKKDTSKKSKKRKKKKSPSLPGMPVDKK